MADSKTPEFPNSIRVRKTKVIGDHGEGEILTTAAGFGYEKCEYIRSDLALPAASQPEAEPVAWHTEDHLADRSATTWDKNVAERWKAKGWPVTPLYTHPTTAPVVPAEGLVEQITSLQIDWREDGENNGQPIYRWSGFGHEARVAFGFDRRWGSKVDNSGVLFDEAKKAEALSYAEGRIRTALASRLRQAEAFYRDTAALRAQQPAAPVSGEVVQEAAIMVADAIDADMRAFNSLVKGFEPRGDWPMKHFFSNALRHYAAALSALEGK